MTRSRRRRVAVLGCADGALAVSLAQRDGADVVAGFDEDPAAIASARRRAAEAGVADRVTFEVGAPADLPGAGYDLVCWVVDRRGG